MNYLEGIKNTIVDMFKKKIYLIKRIVIVAKGKIVRIESTTEFK